MWQEEYLYSSPFGSLFTPEFYATNRGSCPSKIGFCAYKFADSFKTKNGVKMSKGNAIPTEMISFIY